GITEAGKLADFIAANLDLALPAKAELLAIDDVTRRLERLAEFMVQELQVLEVGTQIQEKVKNRLDQNQREYVLREQLQVIRQELGEGEGDDELEELAKRLDDAQLSAEAKKVADRELKRLRQMSPTRHWARASPKHWGASLPACRWAACAMRRRSAVTAVRMSARYPAASFMHCSDARHAARC